MSRGARLALACLASLTSLPGPAQADGCDPACPPLVVVVTGTIGVCDRATGVPEPRCTYPSDAPQGLTWPVLGPAAHGPFTLPGRGFPPVSCTSSAGTCEASVAGTVGPDAAGLGAWCGRAAWRGTLSLVTSTLRLTATIRWGDTGSVATGMVEHANDPRYEGRLVTGLVVTRGDPNGGNCGVTQPTTSFIAEATLVVV